MAMPARGKFFFIRGPHLTTMTLTTAQKEEVMAALKAYAGAYAAKQPEKIRALASKTISGFGSGPDEVVRDLPGFHEQIRRDFSQAGTIALSFDMLSLEGIMPFAWVTAFCTFKVGAGGTALCMNGRMTALLRNTGSRWIFEQIHFSMPYSEQLPGQSFPGRT
jgi:ketosteroid isomerase-like protein